MESIKNWFQDWSDACEYAKECAPDLSFLAPTEPYSALASIAAVCFLVWWWNDKKITQAHVVGVETQTKEKIQAVRFGGLAPTLGWARTIRPETDKKAA